MEITNRFIKFQELQFCNLNYHLLYTGCFVLSQRISVLERVLRCRGTITLQARFRPWPQWHITLTNAYFPLVHLIPKSMHVSHTFAQLISWATSATLGLCLTSISYHAYALNHSLTSPIHTSIVLPLICSPSILPARLVTPSSSSWSRGFAPSGHVKYWSLSKETQSLLKITDLETQSVCLPSWCSLQWIS